MSMQLLMPPRVGVWKLGAAVIVAGVMTSIATAAQTRAVPAFSVASSTGVAVQSSQLSTEHQWLLVLVSPGCVPCDRLLAKLGDPQHPTLGDRAIVLVEGDRAAAAQYITPLMVNGLGSSSWYSDSDGTALGALLLKRTPAVVGVRDMHIEWTIDGVVNDPSGLEQIVRAWLGI
jgi:hypothetical protein